MFGMWIAYMDETGNTGRNLDDPAQPIHLILSLVIEESKIGLVHDHMRDAARRHCPLTCSEDEFEFHGQDLFSGRGYFSGFSPSERIEVYDDVLRGIELAEAEVIVSRSSRSSGSQRNVTATYCLSPTRPKRLRMRPFAISPIIRSWGLRGGPERSGTDSWRKGTLPMRSKGCGKRESRLACDTTRSGTPLSR
jgi:hypothetical protein